MVRFSCFNGNIINNNNNKPKKTASSFVEAMNILHGSSKGQTLENSVTAAESGNAAIPSIERDWKSVDLETTINPGIGLKKSNSEIGLHTKGKVSEDEETDENEYSFVNSVDNSRSMMPDASNDQGLSPSRKERSIFSIEDPQISEKVVVENLESSDVDRSSGRHEENSGDRTPRTPQSIARSQSLPNLSNLARGVNRFAPRSRSYGELYVLDKRQNEVSVHDLKLQILPEEEERNYGDDLKNANDRYEDTGDEHDNFNYESSAREWIVPVMDDNPMNQEDFSSVHQSKDFKLKRIEEWVFDLQPCSPLEGVNEISETEIEDNNQKKREPTAVNGPSSSKIIPGMEAAKRYISALNPAATAAQLSNHGLAVIPFLSAFVSLKVLNLSGNAIVRITAGALPRGLHMLNLSKNHISVIEGLRELTRLRVLDLSYNKIFRIGHGLASCSSLKELYLAGNKISEVEGLHRLLKLNILDLRFNKISTAKCLGQLAANYNSLQAISLEGNPAQKNVGDEPLKKYLQGLLPNLAYYNRQFIKVRAKEGGERSVRLLIGASGSGIRSDYKSSRKGGSSKVASSTHGRRSQGLDRVAKGKQVRVPHGDAKGVGVHHHGDKVRSLRSESIRKSRSVGNLAFLDL